MPTTPIHKWPSWVGRKFLAFAIASGLVACGGGGSPNGGGNAGEPLGTVTLELNLQPVNGVVLPASAVTPMAIGIDYATYTPAQIRDSYGMQATPDWRGVLNPQQSAALGAGQTIYLVTAYRDSNIGQELEAFNTRFDLPPCRLSRAGPTQPLPLPDANPEGCEILQVGSTSAGNIATTLGDYNSAWAHETALDVQWAHATAPLARLVLIEAQDATLSSMLGAIKLANQMGPGVVSMSFGCPEGSWTADTDNLFSSNAMSYVAATGDRGPEVTWPAVSARVLAVGGTTLRYIPGTPKVESSWNTTGGGVSAYTPAPNYQTARLGSLTMRAVADVAMNADPNTGQYVARIAPGASTPTWTSAGGTSLAAVQWAGLLAVGNAQRKLAGKAPLGAPHEVLYSTLLPSTGSHPAAFTDVNGGTSANCSHCAAAQGYDTATGLGTPNIESLLALLVQDQQADSPVATPIGQKQPGATRIQASTFEGGAGQPFKGTIAFSDPIAAKLTVTISGIPAGVQWTSNGAEVIAQWLAPRRGNFPLVVSTRSDLGQRTETQISLTVN